MLSDLGEGAHMLPTHIVGKYLNHLDCTFHPLNIHACKMEQVQLGYLHIFSGLFTVLMVKTLNTGILYILSRSGYDKIVRHGEAEREGKFFETGRQCWRNN